MRVSERGANFIKSFEQCKLVAYPDPKGVLTIGWGHTGPEVKRGLRWTQERADRAFESDLQRFERDVSRLLKVQVAQNQYDALVSFAFNVGPDIDADTIAEGLGDSTLLRKLNAGDMSGAAEEFLKWNKCRINGKLIPLAGLTRRRKGERAMFLGLPFDAYLAA